MDSLASRLLLYAVFAEYLHFVHTPRSITPPHLGHFLWVPVVILDFRLTVRAIWESAL